MPTWGTITLMGSGELTDSMARVHRSLLARVEGRVRAVFLDTPAGFELNADEVSARAVEYFQRRFGINLAVASYKSKTRATPRQVEDALRHLREANYILAGPGSPSYAIRQWRGSAIWDTLVARLMEGAHLVFASAGAIAASSFALPVYEIYKAGQEVDWIDGLDLLGMFGLKLAIIPHWNNAEGGTYDTRYCWMGEPRLKMLETKLPFDVVMLGIDEHTACTFEIALQECAVYGNGGATRRYKGQEEYLPGGSTFPFASLRAESYSDESGAVPANTVTFPDPQFVTTRIYLSQLAHAMEKADAPAEQRELIDHAHDTMHELAHEWRAGDQLVGDNLAPFVELLIETRSKLRALKQFVPADEIRERLEKLGVVIEDTPEGTVWRKRD